MTVVALLVASGTPQPDTPSDAAGQLRTARRSPGWLDIDGRPLIWHAVRRLLDAGVDRVVISADRADQERATEVAQDRSFAGAVTAIVAADGSLPTAVTDTLTGSAPHVVLVHDPARAFAPVAMIQRVLEAVRGGAEVVVPVLPVVDTIRAVGGDGRASALVDRDALRIVQTPQGFAPAVLPAGVGGNADPAAAAVAAGAALTTVPGHADASRVLTAGDVDQARRALGTTLTAPSARRVDVRG